MTQTLTPEAIQEIYEAAVHVEATLGAPDAEFDLYCKLDDVGGVDVTIRKLIDMLRAANREAQPVMYASEITLAHAKESKRSLIAWSEPMHGAAIPLYTTPPSPAVPDGHRIMPLTLTAANGAKGALSGEFKVSRPVRCYECGGEGCDDCGDAGEFEEEITVPWVTIKEIYHAAVGVCSLSPTQDAVDIFADQVIGTKTKIIRMPAPLNVPQEGIRVYLNADELFMQLEKQGYIVEVSNE